ncbi:MAG: hypothetical protein AAF844_13635, partial [Pseudomonadota bacterium]
IAQPPHPLVEIEKPGLPRHADLLSRSRTASESANRRQGEVFRGPQLVADTTTGFATCDLMTLLPDPGPR